MSAALFAPRTLVAQLCSVDLRSLALFRLGLGFTLLGFLAASLTVLPGLYTDQGILPLGLWAQSAEGWRWSLHALHGSTLLVGLLILGQCALAVMLVLGWHARLTAALSFLLLASLLHRNPLLIDASAGLLATLLFSAMLLPLSARYSVDAALAANPLPSDSAHASALNGALMLLILASMVSGALGLMGDAQLTTGSMPLLGLHLIALTLFIRPALWHRLAHWEARRHPGCLRIYYDRDCALCHKALRLLCQFLVLPRAEILPAQDSPRTKTLFEANRSWVVIDAEETAHLHGAALTVILQNSAWLAWAAAFSRKQTLAAAGERWIKFWGARARQSGWGQKPLRQHSWQLPQAWPRAGAVVLAAQCLFQLSQADLPWLRPAAVAAESALGPPLRALALDTAWSVHSSLTPTGTERWLVVPGVFADGAETDLLRHPESPSYEIPDQAALNGNRRWEQYHRALGTPAGQASLKQYADYLCRQIYAPARAGPLRLKIIEMQSQETMAAALPRLEQNVLLRYECPAPAGADQG